MLYSIEGLAINIFSHRVPVVICWQHEAAASQRGPIGGSHCPVTSWRGPRPGGALNEFTRPDERIRPAESAHIRTDQESSDKDVACRQTKFWIWQPVSQSRSAPGLLHWVPVLYQSFLLGFIFLQPVLVAQPFAFRTGDRLRAVLFLLRFGCCFR